MPTDYLEKILTVIKAIGQVVVIVDEGDRAAAFVKPYAGKKLSLLKLDARDGDGAALRQAIEQGIEALAIGDPAGLVLSRALQELDALGRARRRLQRLCRASL